ncbi:MAG: hypothetical protein CMH65_01545 [Nevskiales bacterium]|nr:hypothetical protein [Nevskiales bacterium]
MPFFGWQISHHDTAFVRIMTGRFLAREIVNRPGAADWRVLRALTAYRWIVSVIALALIYLDLGARALGIIRPELFLIVALGSALHAMGATVTLELKRPALDAQTLFQTIADMTTVGLWMWTTGGVSSGLGVLMVFPMIAASLLLNRRMVLLVAALTSIGLLTLEVMRSLSGPDAQALTEAGLLGLLMFAMGLTSHALAGRARRSEALARQVGGDLVSLSRLNESIVARIRAGVIAVTGRGTIQLVNPAARRLIKLDASAHGRALDAVAPWLASALNDWRTDPTRHDDRVLASNGKSVSAQFVRLGWGDRAPVLIMLEDADALAQQAQQMKLAALGRLSASIAHEIRNPLNAISNAAQLLEESPDLGEDDHALNAIVRRNAGRIESIVRDVLSLSRPGPSAPIALDLHAELLSVFEQFRESGLSEHCELDLSGVDPALQVMVDPNHLRRILTNLWENSCEHATTQPVRLTVTARQTEDSVAMKLTDNGPGVSAADAEHIFEPFFTTRAAGTGLGLFLAKELARHNGGQLTLEPSREGACFRLQLPARMTDAGEPAYP